MIKINENMTDVEILIFNKVRSLLTTDLIPTKFKNNAVNSSMYGHCYHATLAMYSLLGGRKSDYKIKCGIDIDGIKHYWLEIEDRIIDPTVEQYSEINREPPYGNYSRCDYRQSKASKYLVEMLKD